MHIHHRFSALRAIILGSLTVTATLVAPVVSGSASGAPQQFTLLEHSGQQTTSQYWEPTLNQRTDYTTPINYAEGRVYIKLDVLQKPSAKPVVAQLCMWRHTATTRFKFETCARTTKTNLTFTKKGTYYHDAGEPAAWYKKNGVWDWTRGRPRSAASC